MMHFARWMLLAGPTPVVFGACGCKGDPPADWPAVASKRDAGAWREIEDEVLQREG